MVSKTKGDEFRSTTVCIDRYENGVPEGRFYNRYLPQGKSFCGMVRFLVEMEQMLGDMDFPRAFTETRTFAPPSSVETVVPGVDNPRGKVSTFVVRILFRQNASWQGSVVWLEGKQEQSFRSVLELILLIHNALGYTKAS